MSALAPSPLEALPPWPGLPPLFAKREDLLPHGGGAKVRRFLAHLAAGTGGDRRALAVLSERGSHAFLTLARLRRDGATRRPLLLLERRAARTPYAERNRAETLAAPDVRLVRGPLPWLLLRLAWLRRHPRDVEVLGLGGQTPGGVEAAAEAGREAQAQLAALGPRAGCTWHVVAAASGTLVLGLLRALAEPGATRDRLLVVPTGPPSVRWRLRRRLRDEPRVTLLPAPPTEYEPVLAAAQAFHAHTGIRLDPRHGARAWLAVSGAALPFLPEHRLLLWVTGPHLADEGSAEG